jgi:hypothetical protein
MAATPPGTEQPQWGVPRPTQVSATHEQQTPYDPWETEEQLCHLQRVLNAEPPKTPSPAITGPSLRIDPGHGAPGRRRLPASHAPRRSRGQSRRARSALHLVAWFVLLIGLMGMACGGVLLGWSLIAARQDLWPIGLPVALVGQIVLVIGLVLQMDRIWNDHSHASAKLDRMDERLADLKSTTALLGTTHSTPAVSFYSHFAGGANPQILLADLKSQLDLLALKLGHDAR